MNEYSNENKPFKKRQRFLTAPPAPPGFTIGRATGRSTGPASRSLTMRTSPRISKLQKSFLKISEKNNLKTTIDEINIIKNSYPYNKSYDAVLAFLQSKLTSEHNIQVNKSIVEKFIKTLTGQKLNYSKFKNKYYNSQNHEKVSVTSTDWKQTKYFQSNAVSMKKILEELKKQLISDKKFYFESTSNFQKHQSFIKNRTLNNKNYLNVDNLLKEISNSKFFNNTQKKNIVKYINSTSSHFLNILNPTADELNEQKRKLKIFSPVT